MLRPHLLLFAVLIVSAFARTQSAVVPQSAATTDAPGRLWAAGATTALRQQILVDQRHLVPLVGKQIVAISFRRDFGYADELPAGTFDAVLTLSSGRHAEARLAVETMDLNHGFDRVQVHAGPVLLPQSPRPEGRSPNWSPEDVIRIHFPTAPFHYRGGTLCIDLHGEPLFGGDYWPIDAASAPGAGTTRVVGTSCQDPLRVAPVLPANHRIAQSQLVPGSTVVSVTTAVPGATAVLLLGIELQPPLSLAFAGAPACWLHVDTFATLGPHVVPPAPEPLTPWTGGIVAGKLQIPSASTFVGSRFLAQWLELDGQRLAATNAVEATLGAAPASGWALVEGHADAQGAPATHGEVRFDLLPVLRIEAR